MTKKSKYQNRNNNWGRLNSLTILGSLFSVLITFFGGFKTLASEETRKNNIINAPVLFQPPPGEKQPEDTKGGGSRDEGGTCDRDITDRRQKNIDNRSNLTAIAPNGYDGLTTVEHPTFWVSFPQTSAQQAILLIKKGSNPDWYQLATHWQQSIDLTGDAGIVGIELSKDAPALEIGKNYQWVVVLVCGNKPNPNDPLVAAGIRRIDRSQISRGDSRSRSVSEGNTAPTTELDKASLYARRGIWYDALDILVAEKSSLNNWNDIWIEYLQSGGLAKEIANEPVIGRLTME